jgi:hypothetical protein
MEVSMPTSQNAAFLSPLCALVDALRSSDEGQAVTLCGDCLMLRMSAERILERWEATIADPRFTAHREMWTERRDAVRAALGEAERYLRQYPALGGAAWWSAVVA